MQKQRVPRPSCEEELGFVDTAFKYSSWLKEHDIDDGVTSLPQNLAEQLLNDLALRKYLQNGECQVQSTFMINDCTGETQNQILPEGASCKLDTECRSISCCVESLLLMRNFSISFLFDSCDMILTINIEKFDRRHSIFEFALGQEQQLDLFGTVKISYIVTDLPLSAMYALKLDYRFCVDTTTCLTNITLLDNYLFPKHKCQRQYTGFDLERFGENIGTSIDDTLDTNVIPIYLHQSGLANFLRVETCDRFQDPYQGRQWTSGSRCAVSEPAEQLPDTVSCFINDDCSEVHYCMDAYLIKRTLSVDLKIDPCLMNMHIAIENFHHTIALTADTFGLQQIITLAGIVTIRFATISCIKYTSSRLFKTFLACFYTKSNISRLTIL
ncbi:uncharacterized protein LOC128557592 [Mercenaria mercenaria]|uniref:uncharacterized protein LOC128557592 n=1 Tax=Mercenaria mercenaria TaxID=6596 RepID=UPI00234F0ABA|nr:uncharacterized protein LOC128557592 [Mercenaria mercenaria]